MPSARPSPMWCTSRSEKRLAVWWERAALGLVAEPLAIIVPVVNDGVWQCAHPTLANRSRPFSLDGVEGAGVGGASIRMKFENASMSEMTAGFEMPLALPVAGGVAVKLSVS